jgi:sugar O-acyltransferase (sialic acid O-acetyltransferase NeuD family)
MPDGAHRSRPKKLVIFGAGTLARLARIYFLRDTDYEIVACTVEANYVRDSSLADLPVVAFESLVESHPPEEHSLFVAVGYTQVNRRRADLYDVCGELGYVLPTIVSTRAHCWDDLRIGSNSLVFDAVVIEPNVEIGNDVIVWSGTQISHDSAIEDHCFFGPNAVVLGDVRVGARAFVGANATILNGVAIAPDCVVGAGALVKRDTLPGDVYSAEEARPLAGTRSWEIEL